MTFSKWNLLYDYGQWYTIVNVLLSVKHQEITKLYRSSLVWHSNDISLNTLDLYYPTFENTKPWITLKSR